MTTLNVNTIKPAGSTLNLGESGDSVVLADDVKVNLVKDVGANTLWSSNGSGVLSSVKAGLGGAMRLLSSQTVTSSTEGIYFTTQLTSDYREYVLKYINMHPINDGASGFIIFGSTDNTNWNAINTTSTLFTAQHAENNSEAVLEFYGSYAQNQGTDANTPVSNAGNATDECCSGEFHLFNPASTVYVKNFYGTGNTASSNNYSMNQYIGGYFNTQSAITGLRCRFGSGNIDSGTIKLYGIAS